MKSQRMFMLTMATIMIAIVLQPARTNAQGASAATNLHRAHPAQAFVDGGRKASQEATVTQVMSKLLPDFPDQEVVMLTATFPRGTLFRFTDTTLTRSSTFWRIACALTFGFSCEFPQAQEGYFYLLTSA